jgi:hypothetical protein
MSSLRLHPYGVMDGIARMGSLGTRGSPEAGRSRRLILPWLSIAGPGGPERKVYTAVTGS